MNRRRLLRTPNVGEDPQTTNMGEDDVTKEEHASSDLADLEARRPPRLGCTRGPPLPAKRIWERIGHAEMRSSHAEMQAASLTRRPSAGLQEAVGARAPGVDRDVRSDRRRKRHVRERV